MEALYDRVSHGGIIVHNNWQYTSARAAMIQFRKERNLEYMPLHLVFPAYLRSYIQAVR